MYYARFIFSFIIFAVLLSGVFQSENIYAQTTSSDTEKLKDHIRKVLQKIPTTPGMAVAIVKGDKVIFAEGFGYRDLERKLPINAQTQFYLASTTKSFTAATAKILAEEGKIDLDVPIKTYFPELKLKSPLSAEQITLRDLLTHRSGMGNSPIGIRTSYTGQYDAALIVKLLENYTRPVSPAYRYSNIGYVLTGLALEKATNESWQKLTRDKIFTPLGMKNTTSYASKAMQSGNLALPYRSDNGNFTKLPYKNDATMHAAGGTVSTAEDLAKWLIVMMNDGRFEGKQIISLRSMKEILAPQINQNRRFFTYERYAYGLGWNIATYKGEEFIHCFGTYAGFRPHVSFMPEHDLGVIVLVNESVESLILPDLVANEIYDHLLDKKDLEIESNPTIKEYLGRLQQRRERNSANEVKARGERPTNITPHTLPLKSYTGTFSSKPYGEIEISLINGKLFAQMGNLSGGLAHENAETFGIDFLVFRRPSKMTFYPGEDNKIRELQLDDDKYIKIK